VRRPTARITAAAALAAAIAGAGAAAAAPAIAYPGQNGRLLYRVKTTAAKGVLYLRPPAGGALHGVRALPGASGATLSPQGRRIAFAARGDVWIMEADGADQRNLTATPGPEGEPTWSPAGDQLAFTAGRAGRRQIVRVAAAGGAPAPVAPRPSDDHSPAWSAQGRIAFVRHTHRGDDIYAADAATGALARLTKSRVDEEAPTWAPDGARIAFTRAHGDTTDLYVMGADGRGVRRLTRGRRVAAPAWSPDGRRIAFVMRVRGRDQLFVVRPDGQRLAQVTRSSSAPAEPDWEPTGFDPVIAAAGDIACEPADPFWNGGHGRGGRCQQLATSNLLLGMDLAAVLVPGDVQYDDGTLAKFLAGFDPSWGRVKSLIHPVPGNHDFRVPGAAGYFDYFDGVGARNGPAGPRGFGYYSFDIGTWHIVALNSECSEPPSHPQVADCAAGSPQEQWLRADLAAHPAACTLAFWHHPPSSSGIVAGNAAVDPLFQALSDFNVDVLLTGHDHAYERFTPLDPGLVPDPVHGIRQFVVGTGGKTLQRPQLPAVGSEVRGDAFGVLRLTLHPGSYDWTFVPAAGWQLADSGTNPCH
jgi:acid phosphatase type 7